MLKDLDGEVGARLLNWTALNRSDQQEDGGSSGSTHSRFSCYAQLPVVLFCSVWLWVDDVSDDVAARELKDLVGTEN
jgi:hypothetical protein